MRRSFLFTVLILGCAVLPAADKVRPYLSNGPWYPADAGELRKMLDSFFAGLPQQPSPGSVLAIVSPHAGLSYSGRCAAKAYAWVKERKDIRRVILLGLSHSSPFYGAVTSDFTHFATPLGTVSVDLEAVARLSAGPRFRLDNRIMQEEHSLENQLPFLQRVLPEASFRIVPILFGGLDKEDFARVAGSIAPLVDEHTLVVASTDFTHYGPSFGYTPFTRDIAANLTKLDLGLVDAIEKLNFDGYYDYKKNTGITVCGFVPVGVLLRLMENRRPKVLRTEYYKSGDLNGDYSHSVSYVSLVFVQGAATRSPGKPAEESADLGTGEWNAAEQEFLLQLARRTLEYHFANGKPPSSADLKLSPSAKMKEMLGVFVTLRHRGELRGCIGYIVGVGPLYQGVIENALNAAFQDSRFPPLQKAELAGINIEISVLTPLQKIADYKSIRLKTDGVIIRDGYRQAVFLPQVAAETGWGLDEFLGNLCLKAGLAPNAYRTSKTMEFLVFQAQVFAEKEKR